MPSVSPEMVDERLRILTVLSDGAAYRQAILPGYGLPQGVVLNISAQVLHGMIFEAVKLERRRIQKVLDELIPSDWPPLAKLKEAMEYEEKP